MKSNEDLGFVLDYLYDDGKAKHMLYVLKKLGFISDNVRLRFIKKVFENIKIRHRSWTRKSYHKIHGMTEWEYVDYDFAHILYKLLKDELAFRNTFFGNVVYQGSDGVDKVFRRINSLAKPVRTDKFVTATDIASYVFCPASYCIQSSFVEDEPTEEAHVGTELHEENRLVALAAGAKGKHEFTGSGKGVRFYNQYNFEFFDDIRNAKIYYVGHDQASKRYFKSTKGHLVGQPDYVFVNKVGARFVVEEKFRLLVKQSHSLKQHHQAQLATYILGLDELEAQYGYLVYWYYGYEAEKRIVKKCVVFKVEPTIEDMEVVRNAYKNIRTLNTGGRLEFAGVELNAAKCASCVVCKFCGHKTGRFDEIAAPYGKEFYSLISV